MEPWTVSICFRGWKVGGKIKQAFDISVMYKGNHTLGRVCWWTSSSYIHCLSCALCQCIHTPLWNQSQNTQYNLLFLTAYGDKALLLWFYCVFQKSYSILSLWQGLPGCHRDKQRSDTISFSLFCLSAGDANKMHLFRMNASRSQRAVLNLSRYIIVHKDKRVEINPRVLSPSCLSTSRIKSPQKKKQKTG